MKLRFTLLTALGVGLAAAGCGRTLAASTAPMGHESGPPIKVNVADVRVTSASGMAEIPAAIESSRRAILNARLASSIVALAAREGDVVKAGDLLVRLEETALKAALSAARASDEAAARELARARALFASGAATRSEVEDAVTAAERTGSAVIAARESLAFASVRAPFAGRIVRKLAGVGDIVIPGQPLLEIEGDDGLEVVASVESGTHDVLRVGERVAVRIDGVGHPLTATVHDVAPSADPATHRFTVRADIASAPGVRAGLFARILISHPSGEARLLAPSGAAFSRGGLTGVYVIRDGRAWLRWIAPGEAFGDSIEVRAGLDAGERVALDPSPLHDGAFISEARK